MFFLQAKYESVLKSVLPASAVKILELFTQGTKLLFADMKEFAWTNHVLTSTTNWEKACNTLTRHQLEVTSFFLIADTNSCH